MTEAGAAIFKGRLDWQAYDSDYVNDEFERQGGRMWCRQTCRISSTTRARAWLAADPQQNASRNGGELGGPTHQWFGPSGAVIDAQVEISRFYAQDSKEKVGPDREFRIGG